MILECVKCNDQVDVTARTVVLPFVCKWCEEGFPPVIFTPTGTSTSGKTKTWNVLERKGFLLGSVSWYGPWRKYCFFSLGETVFDYSCLIEIATFCNDETVCNDETGLRRNK